MKLVNHTLAYVSGSLLLIIGIWAILFYISMLDEVRDSIDDGLDNYKMLIIQKAGEDSSVLGKTAFDESNYRIRKLSPARAPSIHESYRDTLMYMENEQDFEPVRLLSTVFFLKGQYYGLDVISSMVEEDDLIEDLSYSLVWLYICIILSILLINHLVLRKVWRPFYQLIDQLKQFRLNNNPAFTEPETRVSEFRSLNGAVSRLLKSNVAAYASQKQFIENAAHELQTPLAIAINKLELLAEENTLNENQVTMVYEVMATLDRLTRLNKSLLLLSKIENRQFPEEVLVNFNLLLKQLLDDFSDLIRFRQVQVTLTEQGTFSYRLNKDLALILCTNLLKNAILHSQEQGEIRLEIRQDELVIANTGRPDPLPPDDIFRRFDQDPSKKGSTGLGLAIAKTICDHYQLNLSYTYDGLHRFRLSPAGS
jgi:signal transduction histidine kinase